MHRRLSDIPSVVSPEILLGLSYHAKLGGKGFTHYAAVKVANINKIPDHMVSLSVPKLTYAQTEHNKGQSVKHSYDNLYEWIRNEGYQENNVDGLTHFEQYPMKQDPYDTDPEFTILVPVTK
ncbi:GyrI-like domain-containing protein [Pseudalkalibacillus berkeleyi]|uniref:Effector binding domain-containing protein n=1 Tax=Pseudalkalibacillus berkeleyi TaxID=1069813 RepID=A0ABS9GY06_9BACL|nr:effector binding domain-containing protein [Pseudalkalibacillus berkeleyi]MCF6136551.1 effector binding domain-containing protein [Pseudalkalibacillus berkeleyi]